MPVALDHRKDGEFKKGGAAFWSSVSEQTGGQYIGLWVVTSDGRVLSSSGGPMAEPSAWTERVLADLRSGTEKFGTIAPRHVPAGSNPGWGLGTRADGSVALAVSNKLILARDLSAKLRPNEIGELKIDSVTLSGDEVDSQAAPPDASLERFMANPRSGRLRWIFPILNGQPQGYLGSQGGDQSPVGRSVGLQCGTGSPSWLTQAASKRTHREVRTVYTTELQMITGVGSYDTRTREMLSLTWVWEGPVFVGSELEATVPTGTRWAW